MVDKQQIDRHYNMTELGDLYTLTKPDYKQRPTPALPQDEILRKLLFAYPDKIYKFHEHDSLLENKADEELSEAEKQEAWKLYENDEQMSKRNSLYSSVSMEPLSKTNSICMVFYSILRSFPFIILFRIFSKYCFYVLKFLIS